MQLLSRNQDPVFPDIIFPQAKEPLQNSTIIEEEDGKDPEKTPTDDYVGIPDGGTRAWVIVLAGFLCFCTGFGIVNSWGTFQERYEGMAGEGIGGWTPERVTWIGNLQTGILFSSGIAIGPVSDRWGARPLIIIGSILVFVSCIAMANCRAWWQFLITQGIMLSLRNALMFYATVGAIAEWFDKKRGVALGLAASGSSVGGIFWPSIINALFQNASPTSPRWVYRGMGLICLPFLLLSCVFIKGRKGLAGHDTHGRLTDPSCRNPRKAIFRWDFIAFIMSEFLVHLGFLIPFGFIPTYATSHGIGLDGANVLLSICYGGSVFGRVLAGMLGDRFGRFNILSLICFLTGMMTLLWIKMTTFPTMVAFSLLYGLFSGGIMPLTSTCVAQITPDMGYLGLRIGFMMAILSITLFISTPISTRLRTVSSGPGSVEASDRPSGFTALFIFSGITTILGGVCILFTRFKWGSKGNFAF
ncbi:unnamed protein product [Clonostachys byssicola]|uniref:Major facilitator superfamily (MFS) profile domain-containing protein n=1 Tax=Clonostachys byssicola TaxID=160290 RepID=A0A9N9UZF0_9HYPO|nr:unnamed protein product [Clonostachys byssicola]